ncbi:MAG TPA: protein translocase subunit SecF [Gemmatimonadales bacterium]|nr:protein translocase subunit SecF [Gemmatimonadales bacterium]
MTRFFAHANYDFIALRKWAYIITALFVIPGLIVLAVRGLNYSVEFTGGTMIQIRTNEPVDVGVLRGGLDKAGVRGAEIQSFGSNQEYVIRAGLAAAGADSTNTQSVASEVTRALDATVGQGKYQIRDRQAIGPKVGGELRSKAFLAIFLSFFAVLAYLAFRFEWRFGVAAVLATAHDILATIAFVSFLHLEVSLTVVAAILSMVGYSLNDTIIIFDRARENLHKHKEMSFKDILNRSINETLPRSVLTHGTTLASLIALTIWGGEVIRPFALVMLFGVATGTFSSIYIASPLLMWIEEKWPAAHIRGTRKKEQPSAASRRRTQTVS